MDLFWYYLAAIIFVIILVALVLGSVMAHAFKHQTRPPLWVYTAAGADVPPERVAPPIEPMPELIGQEEMEEWLAEGMDGFAEEEGGAGITMDPDRMILVMDMPDGKTLQMRVALLLDDEDNEVDTIEEATLVFAKHDTMGWYEVSLRDFMWVRPTIQ